MDAIKEKKKKNRPENRNVTDEIRQLYEIKDICDELSLLRRVFEAQYGVLENLSRLFWPGLKDQSKRCRESFLEDCNTKGLIDRTEHLDENARKTLEGVSHENMLIISSSTLSIYCPRIWANVTRKSNSSTAWSRLSKPKPLSTKQRQHAA
jgi:hypothetical protein